MYICVYRYSYVLSLGLFAENKIEHEESRGAE